MQTRNGRTLRIPERKRYVIATQEVSDEEHDCMVYPILWGNYQRIEKISLDTSKIYFKWGLNGTTIF